MGAEAEVDDWDMLYGTDPLDRGVQRRIVRKVQEGYHDGGLASPPCATCARARWANSSAPPLAEVSELPPEIPASNQDTPQGGRRRQPDGAAHHPRLEHAAGQRTGAFGGGCGELRDIADGIIFIFANYEEESWERRLRKVRRRIEARR